MSLIPVEEEARCTHPQLSRDHMQVHKTPGMYSYLAEYVRLVLLVPRGISCMDTLAMYVAWSTI